MLQLCVIVIIQLKATQCCMYGIILHNRNIKATSSKQLIQIIYTYIQIMGQVFFILIYVLLSRLTSKHLYLSVDIILMVFYDEDPNCTGY